MSLTLHKVAVLSDEEEGHQFTFVFESPHKLLETKSIESSEIHYAGHSWSLVCTRKEDRYLGIFLKWRYTDGNSATAVSTKCKYFMTLVHRHDYKENQKFVTTQKFTTSQSLLGKSRFVLLDELLDQAGGYLDDVGKHIIIELGFSRCSTRFEQTVDVSPANRTRKNASGVYFDTTTFLLANHRWYLRFYTTKVNSNGFPAVYLYLSGKAKGVSLELRFTLSLCNDSTEILTYNFGEGAKFDGFGKTLLEAFPNANKMTEASVSVEITTLMIFKCAPIRLFQQPLSSASRFQRRDGYGSHNGSPYNGLSSSVGGVGSASLALVEAFQDHEGNFWKTDVVRDAKKVTIVVDKGVHHFPNNKTKMVCWSAVLLSLDQQRATDVSMSGFPVVGSFSNFTDDRGYLMTFSLPLSKLEEPGNPYLTESGEIFVRINFLSLQTTSLVVRSGPRFDYQLNHLLLARQELQENHRSLQEMREMSASHASLSMLDDPPVSEGSMSSGQTGFGGGQGRTALSKSLDSLDALSSGDLPMTEEEDYHRFLFSDLLRCFADTDLSENRSRPEDDFWMTSRKEVVSTTREDSIAETIGSTSSDDSSLQLSSAGSNEAETRKQGETVRNIVKYLQQRLPLRITDVIELGSLGTGTVAKSRVDADLVLFSPNVPSRGQSRWMSAVLRCFQTSIMEGSNNQDPFYPLPRCSDFTLSPSALQFSCDGIDIDVQLTFDWDSEGGGSYDAIFDASCKAVTRQDRLWYKLACSRLQKKFLCDQPPEVKEMIKVVKHWRNSVQWKKTAYRPNSYLLSLLVIKAHEETRSFDIKRIIQKMASYILAAELSLSWTLYYVPEKYQVEFDPPTPLVRDPTNPAINVAESLPYWGQLRTEHAAWIRSLGITVGPLGS